MHILDTKLSILGILLKSIEEKVKSLSKWSKYIYREVSWTVLKTRVIIQITKITTQQLDKFNEKIEENATRTERLKKQNHDFSESLNTS